MKNLQNKDLYRPDEVATYFSVSRKTIYCWLKSGTMKGIKIGGVWRVLRQEINKINESQK